jgi:hypothetical protein
MEKPSMKKLVILAERAAKEVWVRAKPDCSGRQGAAGDRITEEFSA